MISNLILDIQGNPDGMNIFQNLFKGLVGKALGAIIGIGTTLLILWIVYLGIKIARAENNDKRKEAKKLIFQLIGGIVFIVVFGVGLPLAISSLMAWYNENNSMNMISILNSNALFFMNM